MEGKWGPPENLNIDVKIKEQRERERQRDRDRDRDLLIFSAVKYRVLSIE